MRLNPALIVITDRAILAGGSNLPMSDAVRAAAAGGATIIQHREKHLEGAAFLREADELRAALEGGGIDPVEGALKTKKLILKALKAARKK